jgi:hypothetical protein
VAVSSGCPVEQLKVLEEPVALKKLRESEVRPTEAGLQGWREASVLAEPAVLVRFLAAAVEVVATSGVEVVAQTQILVAAMRAVVEGALPIPTPTWFQMSFTLKVPGWDLAR